MSEFIIKSKIHKFVIYGLMTLVLMVILMAPVPPLVGLFTGCFP